MKYDNPLYKKQGMHTVNSIFTVEDGKLKVLLLNRKLEPFKGMWALVSGAIYNNETVEDGTNREIKEKTGLEDIKVKFFKIYSDINRAPEMRMLGIANFAVVNSKKVEFVRSSEKTNDVKWFEIDEINELAFDHKEILLDAVVKLQKQITKSSMLKALLPKEFTMPQVQKIYEAVLNKTFDRRNFSKKMLSLGLLKDLNKLEQNVNKKPAKLYAFKSDIKIDRLF